MEPYIALTDGFYFPPIPQKRLALFFDQLIYPSYFNDKWYGHDLIGCMELGVTIP